MTPVQLAVVCSVSVATVPTAGWIYTLRALCRSRQKSAAQSNELDQMASKLAKSGTELRNCTKKRSEQKKRTRKRNMISLF